MKFFFDLLPVILFFATYKIAGGRPEALDFANHWLGGGISAAQAPILIATAVAIAATLLQIMIVWIKHRHVDTMLWISLAIVSVFGGATLWLHDPTFIKWKPTALYWLFAIALAGSDLLFKRNLIRRMLEAQVQLPEAVWTRLNLAWMTFFLCMGVLNLYVAFNYSEESWVNFKLFGVMGLMLAFVVGQSVYLSRHMKEES